MSATHQGAFRRTKTLAYMVGVALGDGNLSNPNGRAVRLRITCDARYPIIRKEILRALRFQFPRNKVSVVQKSPRCYDISVYSNDLKQVLPWQAGHGSKYLQNAHVPQWIMGSRAFTIACLRGLLQTDGSVYLDRGYRMVNFTNNTKRLAEDVFRMVAALGFSPTFHSTQSARCNTKYTVRVAKSAEHFIRVVRLVKA